MTEDVSFWSHGEDGVWQMPLSTAFPSIINTYLGGEIFWGHISILFLLKSCLLILAFTAESCLLQLWLWCFNDDPPFSLFLLHYPKFFCGFLPHNLFIYLVLHSYQYGLRYWFYSLSYCPTLSLFIFLLKLFQLGHSEVFMLSRVSLWQASIFFWLGECCYFPGPQNAPDHLKYFLP